MLLSTFAQLSYLNKCGRILLYFTLALTLIVAFIGFLTKRYNPDKMSAFSKYALGIFVGYALCACAIMVTLKIDKMVAEGELIPLLFYPILACICVGAALVIGGLIVNLLKAEKFKSYLFISMGIFAIPLIISIIMISIYYNNEIKGSNYYTNVSNAGLIIGAIALVILIFSMAFAFGKKKEKTTTNSIVYASICIALSFALSYIRLFRMPQGGSVTLVSMLPLMLYSYMFGIRKGVGAGLLYGIMQALQDPWIIHPAQFLLDYPIAFASIGLAGIIKEINLLDGKPVLTFTLGASIAGTIRYFCHVLSGIFAFSCYAREGVGAIAWGFLYNTVTLVDLVIVLVAGTALLLSKSFNGYINKVSEL